MKKAETLVLFAVILVFWKLFIPIPRVSNDFQIIHPQNLRLSFNLPQTWSSRWAEGLGEYSVGTLWSWPLDFLYGLGGILGIDFWMLERILGIFPALFLSFWSMGMLLRYLGILGWGRLIGQLFYSLNSYFLLLLDGGQFNLALAYSILPLVFVLFRQAIDQNNFRETVKFGLAVTLISIFDIRVIVILFILFAADFFFNWSVILKKRSYLKVGIISLLMATLLHAYWIVPSFLNQSPALPSTYSRPNQLSNLSFANIGHALVLLQPHWYKNIFGQVTAIKWEFVFIPLLVFLAPILKRRDVKIAFWLFISLIGAFLSKGSNPPFQEVNLMLFKSIPGFTLFRDPTKFFFLISLGYAVLISITVLKISQKKWLKFFPILVLIYLFWLVKPLYLGQMTGVLGDQQYQREYAKLANFFESDQKFSRIFWIPAKAPLAFASPTHPSVEAARFAPKRPFATGTIGTYETFNFLREASYSGQLLDVAGVGYIVYPYLDVKTDDLSPDKIRYFYTFSQQLSNLPWLKREEALEIPTFKVIEHQDEIFMTPNTWWIIGSDDLYAKLQEGKLNLSENALIFAEEIAGLSEKLEQFPEAKIILNEKELIDLAASFIKAEFLISPAAKLDFSPSKSGWWKREAADLVWWRSFLQEKYGIDNQDFDLGLGWAVGEGNLKFQISNFKFQKDKVLLARVMESSKSGRLKFYQDNRIIGEVSTKIDDSANIRWFEVGQITADGGELVIESTGDINVVNALAVLDKDLWKLLMTKAQNLQEEGRIKDLSREKSQEEIKISFKKINPTTYQVNVANLTKPVFLILSQSFNRLWKMDNQSSVPVYSLLNGFRVDKNGQYQISFEPQRNVERGFAISLLSMIFLIGYLLTRQKRES